MSDRNHFGIEYAINLATSVKICYQVFSETDIPILKKIGPKISTIYLEAELSNIK
jgi:hypothetical protein